MLTVRKGLCIHNPVASTDVGAIAEDGHHIVNPPIALATTVIRTCFSSFTQVTQLFGTHDASRQGSEKLYLFRSHQILALRMLVILESAAGCLDVVALG